MNSDISKWTKSCIDCQKSKIQFHTKSEIGRFPITRERFRHIHLDLVGPLPCSHGFSYLLTILDRYTRWPEVYPLKDSLTTTITKKIFDEYIPRFGVPDKIATDQGVQFESYLFSEFSKMLGIQRLRSSPYHPQSNGLVERFHRTLKTALRASPNSKNWSQHLPSILLGLRTTVKEELKCCPAELVYGQTIRVPGEFFIDEKKIELSAPNLLNDIRNTLKNHINIEPRKNKSKVFIPKDLNNCDYVFLHTSKSHIGLNKPYDGPFPIIKRNGKNFTININGKETTVSIDRLKPAYTNCDNNENPNQKVIKPKKVRFSF